jgi:ABC-type branched-subunit amino acid transport system substrate-binding protein
MRAWLRRIAVPITVAITVAGLVATTVVAANQFACGGLRSGLTRVDGECVGVSAEADTYYFSDDLRSIQDAIKRENDRVHQEWMADPGQNRYVKVALLSPLTATRTSFMNQDQIRHAVQGAYVAQRRANTTKDFDDQSPLIQLVLANEGGQQAEWRRVVRKLEEMAADEHPMVAVIGMGTSIAATRDAAQYLSVSASALPMIAGVTTSDEFRDIEGFTRVSPSDSDYVAALASYLAGRNDLRSGMLVYDRSEPDLYVRDLRLAYEAQLGDYLTVDAKSYFGEGDSSQNQTKLFSAITESVCNVQRLDMILYAGRALDLDDFVESLSGRTCRANPVAILVGATGLTGLELLRDTLTRGKITVVNAAAIDPGWFAGSGTPKVASPTYFPPFAAAFEGEISESDALADGYAIIHHDAMATAVKAIRTVARQLPGADQVPTAGDVRGQLLNLNNGSEVRGAGGTLSFTTDRLADPVGKWVPIILIPAPAAPGPARPTYITRTTRG